VDSKENMAQLAIPYVILSSDADDIVYLWRLQKSPKFAIFVGFRVQNLRFSPFNFGTHFKLKVGVSSVCK